MLIISGAGIAGLSLLYFLSQNGYKGKIILVDKNDLSSRDVSMFVFLDKFKSIIPTLKNLDHSQYLEYVSDSYSYSLIENQLNDYRTIQKENVVGVVNYKKLGKILYDLAKKTLDVKFVKGNVEWDNGFIVNGEKIKYDLLVDAMGYNSPIPAMIKKPKRYFHVAVKEYEEKSQIKDLHKVRLIVNITKGGCWLYPNEYGFEIGSGILNHFPVRSSEVNDQLDKALDYVTDILNVKNQNNHYYKSSYPVEPILDIYDRKLKVIRVGDGVGMADPYVGTGAIPISEEMKILASYIPKQQVDQYAKQWREKVVEFYLPRVARSMVLFGPLMDDKKWKSILIKRAKAESHDVISKASSTGKHSFLFNLRLLPLKILVSLVLTKRKLKRNIQKYDRLVF